MNKHSDNEQPAAVGMMAALGMNPIASDAARQAMQSWLDGAGEAQSRMIDYWNRRSRSDTATLGKMAKCKSPAELWATQVEWANGFYEDLATEGRYVAESFSKVARVPTSGPARHS